LVAADGSQGTSVSTAALIDTYREPLAHYAASRAYEIDSSDEANAGLAVFHRQTALALVRDYNQVPLAVMVGFLNDGVHAVLARYPYLAAYTELTAAAYTTALPFGAEFRDSIAHFIAARVLEGHPDVEALSQHHHQIADVSMRNRRPDNTAALVAFVNAGIHELVARRPYVLLDDAGALGTFTEITTGNYTSLALPVDEAYREGLAHYVAARVHELGPPDEENAAMARVHRDLYMAMT
jgi:hypothetical protein